MQASKERIVSKGAPGPGYTPESYNGFSGESCKDIKNHVIRNMPAININGFS
jgi:hypothetical protein